MSYNYFPIEFSSYEDYVKYLKEKGFAIEVPEENTLIKNKVMTQEDKQLLLVDICARLPYSVKYLRESWNYEWDQEMSIIEVLEDIDKDGYINNTKVYTVEDIKPYLRSISSMTDEEYKEYSEKLKGVFYGSLVDNALVIDWLNKKMFDYRGLIQKGLALEAPEGMYVNETELEFHAAQPDVDHDEVNENGSQISVGCKIRSKTNPDVVLSIISDDCHGDEFECSNGSVLSLKQIEKYYELIK